MVQKTYILVLDNVTGKRETVFEKTTNSYHVTQSKLTDRGIDCSNWFDKQRFKKRFKIIEE